jgi:hypothetical protein
MISCVIPISTALSKTLGDSLNTERSKISGIITKVENVGEANVGHYLLVGFIAVIYGLSIYYLLPLSLLTANLSLMLAIFFFILLGIILGLTMITYNFQSMLEFLLLKIILFWERKSMQILIVKNLIAHKLRNQLTAIIYSLTLGCLIFLVVMLNIEITILTTSTDIV